MSILGVALDASTNPDPNTLSVSNPFPNAFRGITKPSDEWKDQGTKAFAILNTYESKHHENINSVGIDFIPSDPDAIYTITLWVLSPFEDWSTAENLGTNTYTGRKFDYAILEGLYGKVCYLSIDSIDSGTLSIAVGEGSSIVEVI